MSNDDEERVKELVTEDGRQVMYSVDSEDDMPADTEEWIATNTTVSGSDQQ